eukprot:CAMPEP_0172733200 /NCGR_PEP_ID=MMETSP1074-20121228/106481_1 /TAXON_ID=2916 /ORGANISM="Ceratium fusus, Strain PA161109" /LENGTH=40 /DNA_ID= /DNA_START= /DNA_END= /DNA_ORIENTATION=
MRIASLVNLAMELSRLMATVYCLKAEVPHMEVLPPIFKLE